MKSLGGRFTCGPGPAGCTPALHSPLSSLLCRRGGQDSRAQALSDFTWSTERAHPDSFQNLDQSFAARFLRAHQAVRSAGYDPARHQSHRGLSAARLPIPPRAPISCRVHWPRGSEHPELGGDAASMTENARSHPRLCVSSAAVLQSASARLTRRA